jgi:hypothetical protein
MNHQETRTSLSTSCFLSLILFQTTVLQTSIMKTSGTILLVINFLLSTFLFDSVSCWSSQVPLIGRRTFVPAEQKQTPSKAEDSRLNFRKGDENHDLQLVASSVIAKTLPSPQSLENPNPIDLPKHSPPPEVVQKVRFLWDMEMTIGRVAMVAAMFLLAGEVFTGLSVTDQVGGLFR